MIWVGQKVCLDFLITAYWKTQMDFLANPVFTTLFGKVWYLYVKRDFPGGSDGKASAYNVGDPGSIPGSGRSQRRKWQPTLVFLPGESHGWRSLVGYSPWGPKELDMTEQLHFHFGEVWYLYVKEDTKTLVLDLQKHGFPGFLSSKMHRCWLCSLKSL